MANNPKRVSSNGRVKNSKNNILSGSINHGRRSSQVNDYSDGEVIFKKKNKYQLKTLALNSDIKADLDISGSHSSQRISPKRPKYLLSEANVIVKPSHIKSLNSLSVSKRLRKPLE